MRENKPVKDKTPKPGDDVGTPLQPPLSDEAKEIAEKGEPDGGGNFA
jgi:hypothetical protein